MQALRNFETFENPHPPPVEIKCRCGHVIFKDGVIHAKVVNVKEGEARCRCKRWVDVPVYWDRIGS